MYTCIPNPGIEPRSPTLQADSLPAEPQGKPRNTGMGSLSLLQQIFLTQESNRGLLHCRGILYQLSYQGHAGLQNKSQKFKSIETILSINNNIKYLNTMRLEICNTTKGTKKKYKRDY